MFHFTSALSLCILLTAVFEAVQGQDNLVSDVRIISGNVATSKPTYMVSILELNESKKKYEHICAAVIIASDCILTLESCIQDPSNLIVRAGVSSLTSILGSTYSVVNYVVIGTTGAIGSALVVALVSPAFSLGAQISVAKLTADSVVEAGDAVMVYGWGQVDLGASLNPNINQVLITKVYDSDLCKIFYRNLNSTTSICTLLRRGQGLCKGDRGGPVLLKATAQLVGIVSHVSLPCGIGYPEVSTLIGPNLALINSVVANLSEVSVKV